MRNLEMLHPVFALAAWTFLVLLLIPFVRVRSVRRREIGPNDFKYGESSAVPPDVSIPNRNYMNLLEMPMLFYIICVVLYVTGGASRLAVATDPIPRFARLRGITAAISRIHGLRRCLPRSGLSAVGWTDAGRCHRWGPRHDCAGHCGSPSNLHCRVLLRRLRRACRRGIHAGPVFLRCQY